MLSTEKQFFLKCLRDYCNNIETEKPANNVDYSRVFQYSQDQALSAILYSQCSKWIHYRYRNSVIQEAYYSINRKELLKEFINHMERRKIPFICMKGSVFRDYYSIPELRSMGDIDIIIRQENKEQVDDLFVNSMKFIRYVDNHSVWTYYLNDFQFEVHNHMFYEDLANNFDYKEYFDHIFDHKHHDQVFGLSSEYMYVPDENYHFLYLITHTAKHIINNGLGFRAYLDMVMFTRNNNHLDWQWIKKELVKMKLLKFTETCFSLCERWFDVKMPLSHKELDESFLEEITKKTFDDGIFGLENKANEGAFTAKEIIRSNDHYLLTSFRLMIKLIFPPYNDLILGKQYAFFIGKPWLLPIGWIYRWIYCIIHKFRYSIGRLTEPLIKKQKIKKREQYIKGWGL